MNYKNILNFFGKTIKQNKQFEGKYKTINDVSPIQKGRGGKGPHLINSLENQQGWGSMVSIVKLV